MDFKLCTLISINMKLIPIGMWVKVKAIYDLVVEGGGGLVFNKHLSYSWMINQSVKQFWTVDWQFPYINVNILVKFCNFDALKMLEINQSQL